MIKLIYFLGGVAVGVAATYIAMHKVTEQEIQEEIEAFKESYKPVQVITSSNQTKMTPRDIAAENAKKKAELFEMTDIVEKQNYNLFSKPPRAIDIHNGIDEGEDLEVYTEEDDPGGPREGVADKPYIIDEDEYVTQEPTFDKITLEYYSDGVLYNPLDEEIIEDRNGAVGLDILEALVKSYEDCLYVRNERISTDYEVIKQQRPFAILPGDKI